MHIIDPKNLYQVSAGGLTNANHQALLTMSFAAGSKAIGDALVFVLPNFTATASGAFLLKSILAPGLGILGTAAGYYLGNKLYCQANEVDNAESS
jgi:hypothetical protein